MEGSANGEAGGLVGDIEKALWDVLDPLYMALTSALVSLVGEIPFVGGILASIVSDVMEVIWTLIKNVVNRVLNTICVMLLEKIEEDIVDAVFDAGKLIVKDVTDSVKKSQKAIAAPLSEKFAHDAAKSEKEAEGVDDKMHADATKMSHQIAGLDKADEAELHAEDAKDAHHEL